MAHYLITLVVETDPTQGSPAGWDWPELIDSPHGVAVIACTSLDEDPSGERVEEVHVRLGLAHRDVGEGVG